METADLIPLIERLDDDIDDLEEAISTLLETTLSETAGKLPLLDKAHLFILVTYAIESILFSYLNLNGVEAKTHPVFQELTRVKQYFEKIKTAEASGVAPSNRLDKAAAGRFIKHALAGNQKHDATVAQQESTRKIPAHIHFRDLAENEKVHGEMDVQAQVASFGDSSGRDSGRDPVNGQSTKTRKQQERDDEQEVIGTNETEAETKQERKRRKKLRKKQKEAERSNQDQPMD